MRRSTTNRTVTPIAAAIVLIAAVAAIATGALAYSASSTRTPTTTPTPAPTIQPSPVPTVRPTAPPSVEPSSPPADGVFELQLRNLTDHDVDLQIDDESGAIVKAESGTPGDGMSVRWFDVEVENIDAQTLRIVWVGLPRDEVVHLGVSRDSGRIQMLFTQDAPPAQSDATGYDRVLRLTFVVPVRAEDVVVTVEERTDTAG
jgi:hypothetical protein